MTLVSASRPMENARPCVGADVDGVLFDLDCVLTGSSPAPSAVTLARHLRAQGYATATFSTDDAETQTRNLPDLFTASVQGEPSPGLLLEAARRVGVPAQRAAVVSSSPSVLGAARGSGFVLCIGVGDPDGLPEADVVVPDLSYVMVEPHVPPSALADLDAVLAGAGDRRPAVFLDYDGTLTPIVARPEQAVLDPAMRNVVARLAALVPVAVVSGRDREAVRRLVQVPGVHYAGSHGLDVEGAAVPVDREALAAVDQAEAILRKRLAGVRGAIVERKRYTVAAHHRLVSESDVPRVEAAANEALAATSGLRRSEGKRVIELRPDVDWDKGTAVRHLLDTVGSPGTLFPVFLGDDVTDEDAFRSLRGLGVGVAVLDEDRATHARFLLRDTDEVRVFLERLAERLEGGA